MYGFAFCNITVAGEDAGLPVEVSRRVLELVIFESYGDESLSRMILYMLMITEETVLALGANYRWKYIAHGQFIADCILNKERFEQLAELIRIDLE